MKYVYQFEEGAKDMKEILGGKGAGLSEMARLGIPVPPGFTISESNSYPTRSRIPPSFTCRGCTGNSCANVEGLAYTGAITANGTTTASTTYPETAAARSSLCMRLSP